MEKLRKISLIGWLSGMAALLVDHYLIRIPDVILIPYLIVAIILNLSDLVMRKKQKKG